MFESLRPDQTIERPDQTDLAFFSSGARSVQFAATDLGNIRAWNLVNSHHFLVSPLIPRDHPFAGMVSDLLSILRMTVERPVMPTDSDWQLTMQSDGAAKTHMTAQGTSYSLAVVLGLCTSRLGQNRQ